MGRAGGRAGSPSGRGRPGAARSPIWSLRSRPSVLIIDIGTVLGGRARPLELVGGWRDRFGPRAFVPGLLGVGSLT